MSYLVSFKGAQVWIRTVSPIACVKDWLPSLEGCCINGGAQQEAFRLLVSSKRILVPQPLLALILPRHSA